MPGHTTAQAIAVACLTVLLGVAQTLPAAADHTPAHSLEQIDAIARALQQSRQAADRYRQASAQYDAAASAAEERIREFAAQEEAAQTEAEALASRIAIAGEQLALMAFQMDETKADIAALDKSLADNQRALADREQLYAIHLRATYRQALVSPLEMLLSSTTITEFATRVQQMAFVSTQDRRFANELQRLRTAAQDQRAAADQKRSELEGLGEQINVQRAALEAEKARFDELQGAAASARSGAESTRDGAAANAQASRQAAGSAARQSADLEQQSEDAQARYAQLVASLQGGGKPWAGGKLNVWPIAGTITSKFGPRWGGFHNGLDIAAPYYRPVVAAASGTVQVVGKPYLAYGDTATVVIIQHAGNFSTLYGHLDDRTRPPVVRVGQFVQAGQVIAYNGSTGFSTGPHVHFMTILNGKAVDPLPYLP